MLVDEVRIRTREATNKIKDGIDENDIVSIENTKRHIFETASVGGTCVTYYNYEDYISNVFNEDVLEYFRKEGFAVLKFKDISSPPKYSYYTVKISW